uniref:Peptidyl-prolyl cis-trans isomerase n=1 Tax=Trichogramma kaykai TaxID=54128 RepID=A0ABD2WRI1_9HYME
MSLINLFVFFDISIDEQGCEEHILPHNKVGTLSMAAQYPQPITSQFFITTVPTPWLDDQHIAFGIVRLGLDVVIHINNCGSSSGKPQREVVIMNCDELREVVQTFPAPPSPNNGGDEQGTAAEDPSEAPKTPATPEEPEADDTVMNELCALVEAEDTNPNEPPTMSGDDSDGKSSSAEELAAIESAARGLQLLTCSGREENKASSPSRSTTTNASNTSGEEKHFFVEESCEGQSISPSPSTADRHGYLV